MKNRYEYNKGNKCIECFRIVTRRAKRCSSCANSIRNSGNKNPMFGKENKWGHHTEESKKKIGMNTKNENHHFWKGDKVGYGALHIWIISRKPKPKLCEYCKKEKKLDLSNNSGKYKRDINDFEWLCRNCHWKKDKIVRNFKNKLEVIKWE